MLRRADWRWLLPIAPVERALCLATGELRESVHALERNVVRRVDDAAGNVEESLYDLVLASNVSERTLLSAARALQPRGVLCAEVNAASFGGIERVRQEMRAAGFDAVQFVMQCDVDSERAWIPLGSTTAARYFVLRHPVPARHPLRRLWLAARRRSAMFLLEAGWFRRLTIVARAGHSAKGEAEAPVDDVTPWWASKSDDSSRDSRDGLGHQNEWVLLTPGSSKESKVVGLVFESSKQWPAYAVKLGRTPAATARIERGHQSLVRLRDAGVTMMGLAPEPYRPIVDRAGKVLATVECAIPGRWLDTALQHSTLERFTLAVTEWLIALALLTRAAGRTDSQGLWERRLRPTIEHFRECAESVVDRALLEEASALIAEARLLPTVFEHHDFTPWNIYLTSDGHLVAFDWDNADPEGVPALDLLQCHAYLGAKADGTLLAARFVSSHIERERGALGVVRRACRERYRDAVGVDDRAMRAVRAFAWMSIAADELQRQRAECSPLRAHFNCSFVGLWEAEARAALHGA